MKILKVLGKIMVAVIIMVLIGLLLVAEVHTFNHGICINCNTSYEAVGTTRHGQVEYVCPNCHQKAYN